MLREIAHGVFVHQSEFVECNSVVVDGDDGVLVIDAGVYEAEFACLASDLTRMGRTVIAGFSTHPHWDHLLWHRDLGPVPRFATAQCATRAHEQLSVRGDDAVTSAGIPDGVPLDLMGEITGLSTNATTVPWAGPTLRIIEHRGHAPGHAALLVEEHRVLVAGDMLSNILIPLLDLSSQGDPVDEYLNALSQFNSIIGDVDVLVPGHGSTGGSDELRARIRQDQNYLLHVSDDEAEDDPRLSGEHALDGFVNVHRSQRDGLIARRRREAASQ